MSFVYNPFTLKLDKVTSSSSSSLWDSISSTATASSTTVVDSIIDGNFKTAKYIASIFNVANNSFKTLEIDILNEGGAYKETVFSRLRSGNSDIEISTVQNAGSMDLTIVNNESFDLTFSAGRLIRN